MASQRGRPPLRHTLMRRETFVCDGVQVLGSTVLVLALVGSSAFLLLGLNSVLSTASAAIFD